MRAIGLLLLSIPLLATSACTGATPKKVTSVTIVVKGTVKGGDTYNVFKVGKSLDGQDFTFTFTFDPSTATPHKGPACAPDAVSSLGGTDANPPSQAILTIGKGKLYIRPATRLQVGRVPLAGRV